MSQATHNPRDSKPKTLSVPEAGRDYFGLSRNGSYEAVRRGEIPAIRIGKKLRVPICRLERMLEGQQVTEAARTGVRIPSGIVPGDHIA